MTLRSALARAALVLGLFTLIVPVVAVIYLRLNLPDMVVDGVINMERRAWYSFVGSLRWVAIFTGIASVLLALVVQWLLKSAVTSDPTSSKDLHRLSAGVRAWASPSEVNRRVEKAMIGDPIFSKDYLCAFIGYASPLVFGLLMLGYLAYPAFISRRDAAWSVADVEKAVFLSGLRDCRDKFRSDPTRQLSDPDFRRLREDLIVANADHLSGFYGPLKAVSNAVSTPPVPQLVGSDRMRKRRDARVVSSTTSLTDAP
jgi:hypothetical protein